MKISGRSIQDFLDQRKIAVIGVSRDTRQLSYQAYNLLKTRGFEVYAVNPNTDNIVGDKCYPNVNSLPSKVGGALVMLPPEKTVQVLPEIAGAGIKQVWLQQQTESEQAIKFCSDHGINVVYGQCIMMFIEPVESFHRFHRWIKKITNTLPK